LISVDRLTLNVPGMSEAEAERLARAVAEALRGWPAPARELRVDRVKAAVDVPDHGSEATETLAARIAAAVMRAALKETSA
jgi:hypothetical protein